MIKILVNKIRGLFVRLLIYKFYRRFIFDFKFMRNILSIAQFEEKCKIFLFSSPPSIIWAIKIIGSYKNSKNKINIILHGGLSSVIAWRSRNPFKRLELPEP